MPVPAHALQLIRTAALVESRASAYAAYLSRIFGHRGWSPHFEQWGLEEATHGQRLGAWLAEHDPGFDVAGAFATYLARVPYHADETQSVYGSEQAELVSRCFVEAMAATWYQAVGGALEGEAPEVCSLRRLCRTLAADEARHYTMFRRKLEALRRVTPGSRWETARVIARRLVALADEQIVTAAWLARGGPGPFDARAERWRHRLDMARVYRPRHARFVARLMLALA